MYKFHLR